MDDHLDFAGFGPTAFDWLDDLAADNSRAFYDASRPTFERELRDPFTAMLRECATWSDGRPRVFRQLRDLRFAANRDRPYWCSIAGEITARPGTASVLVAELSPAGLTALAGYRRPFTRDQLHRYRAAVDDATAGRALADVAASLTEAGLQVSGATLRGMPRGFARSHEHAALLRHTALFAGGTLPPDTRRRRVRGPRRSIDRDAALAHLSSVWAHAEPLVGWLDEHVGAPEAAATAAA